MPPAVKAPGRPSGGLPPALTRKAGGLPVWGWVAAASAGVGLLWWWRKRQSSTTSPAITTPSTTGTGAPLDPGGGFGGGGMGLPSPDQAPAGGGATTTPPANTVTSSAQGSPSAVGPAPPPSVVPAGNGFADTSNAVAGALTSAQIPYTTQSVTAGLAQGTQYSYNTPSGPTTTTVWGAGNRTGKVA